MPWPNCAYSGRWPGPTGKDKLGREGGKNGMAAPLIMNRSIFYIIGVIAVVVIVLKLLGVF
jgi:hypothetical protein